MDYERCASCLGIVEERFLRREFVLAPDQHHPVGRAEPPDARRERTQSQCVLSRFTDTARESPPRTVTGGGDGVMAGSLCMHRDQVVCQAQILSTSAGGSNGAAVADGMLQSGGHKQESRPVRVRPLSAA